MKISQIKDNFSYKLVGSNLMKKAVLSTLLLFPDEIVERVSKKCWFISAFDESWAFVLRGSEIKKSEFVIFLSDRLLKENRGQIQYTIAHEIGHVLLGHRNSIGKVQSKTEIRRQEKEADVFAMKYLKKVLKITINDI